MIRATVALGCILSASFVSLPQDSVPQDKEPPLPSFEYKVVRAHEIKPHRRTIPMQGVTQGFNQLQVALVVSPTGDVMSAEAKGNTDVSGFWPQLEGEVRQWRFEPFEIDGKAVTAEVEEYIDLVPPERLPAKHVTSPILRPSSKISITLRRSGCFGSCPAYTVTVSQDGIDFEGRGYVVASGKHRDVLDSRQLRKLAERFIAADFYSMDSEYVARVTDNPTYELTITIDNRTKTLVDYVGSWVGMPQVIAELEDAVDELAHTSRWIDGSEGLVDVLESEKLNFHTFQAQVMLKEAASRGVPQTVRELLAAGVPLEPIPAPKAKEPDLAVALDHVGWLNAASSHPEALRVLLDAGASQDDQNDKDLALAGAAQNGRVDAMRALIAYGANPNADLSKLVVIEGGVYVTLSRPGAGSVLIYAANSGNPDAVREILHHSPNLEARDQKGRTAVFAAVEYLGSAKEADRVECLRLLAQAGADINARDKGGNTPLHETFLTDVEEELLKLGADVNARNNEGETPIFTTFDDRAIPLFIKHGADLGIRNNKGQTVLEAARQRGLGRQEALNQAIQAWSRKDTQ